MPESELILYLRANRKKFTLDQLREGLLKQGVDAAELDAAIARVSSEKPRRWPFWLGAAGGGAFLILALLYWLGAPLPDRTAAARSPAGEARPGGLAAAREQYRRDFFDPYAHVELAEALYRSGRIVDAFYILEEARALFPEREFDLAHNFVIVGKGKGGWGTGRFDASPEHEAALNQRLKSDPKDWDARGYLAHIEGARGNYDAASALVDQALQQAPNEQRLVAYKGFLSLKKNDLPGAFAAFDKAAALAPDSPDGLSAIEFIGKVAAAKDSKELGELPSRALARLEGVVKDHPDDASAFIALAFARWARGERPAVRDLVKRAQARNPVHAGAAVIEGALALDAKQLDVAVVSLKKALKSDPDNQYALEKLAHLHKAELRDVEGALPYYLALHRLNPHYNDGEYAEARIKEWLVQRRDTLLSGVQRPDQLSPFFAAEDGSLRAEACLRAAKFNDPKLLETLVGLLDDDVGNVTQNADYALFQMGKSDLAALSRLRDGMMTSPRTFIRGMSLNTFADLTPKETLPVALERLKDPEPYVRFRAQGALTHYFAGDQNVQRALTSYRAGEKDPKLLAVLRYRDKGASESAAQSQEAEKQLAGMAQNDPVNASAAKASLLLAARDYPAAIEEYHRTLDLDEKYHTLTKTDLGMLYSGLGDAYLFSDQPARAVPVLDSASKLLTGPAKVHALYNLACAWSMQRKLKEADRALHSCLAAARKERKLDHFVALAKKDPQLANLRAGKSFARLLSSFKK